MSLLNSKWYFDEGDSGDASVGMGPTSPAVYAEVMTPDGPQDIELAQVLDPAYSVKVASCTPECPRDPEYDVCTLTKEDGRTPLHDEYDDGTRLVGSYNEVGYLMAAAADLLKALSAAYRDTPGWRWQAAKLLKDLSDVGVVVPAQEVPA